MDGKSLSALRFPYKSDRLKPLRAFCQTARLGSVSRAAEALYVSQPAISLQLQALERELGVALLERSGRRLVPTREGHVLYELAVPLVEALVQGGQRMLRFPESRDNADIDEGLAVIEQAFVDLDSVQNTAIEIGREEAVRQAAMDK